MVIDRLELKTQPSTRYGYVLPFASPHVEIYQGYNGTRSHYARRVYDRIIDNRFSLDFRLKPDTPVIASRSGKIHLVGDEITAYFDNEDPKKVYLATAHFIAIQHEETYTLYENLARESVLVRSGQIVEQGQIIARTGLPVLVGPKPNLHFSAFKYTKIGRLSFPVAFINYQGPLEDAAVRGTSEFSSLDIQQ